MTTWTDGPVRVLLGDVRERLAELEPESVQCVVTSPPYWGLRDYGAPGQLGLEATPEAYVAAMAAVFRAVWRVLRRDGTLWLNLGDSYGSGTAVARRRESLPPSGGTMPASWTNRADLTRNGAPAKQLLGMPWRVAFALQAAGWYLRSDIIWSKPNPMPESVRDRPTKAHEYLFLLTRSQRYYYDAEAIKEPAKWPDGPNAPEAIQSPYGQGFTRRADKQRGHSRRHAGFNDRWDAMPRAEQQALGANKRSVWEIATAPYPEAHFATFPEALVEPCIKAGTAEGDVVLDPFAGSGTTLAVARRLGRRAIGIELQPDYLPLIQRRVRESAMPLLEALETLAR